MKEIDSSNQFLVTVDTLRQVLRVGRFKDWPPLTPDEAVNLAAWLAALSDPEGVKFARVLDAVRNG